MDFHLSKEQEMIRKMYREFAQNEVKPLAQEIDEEERFPSETIPKLAKLGLLGIPSIPRSSGAPAATTWPTPWLLKRSPRPAAPPLLSSVPTRPCAATPSTLTVPRSRR